MRAKATLLLSLIFPISAGAEGFQGVQFGQTLAEVQRIFPNAALTPVSAVWVTENDGFYLVSGPGFPGKLYIAFIDFRPKWNTLGVEARRREDHGLADAYARRAAQETANALTVKWLRWIPTSPIPAQRYILKYGKPDKVRFNDDNMEPYYRWPSKGVSVSLSDDLKDVQSVEFQFTREDKVASCLKTVDDKKFCDGVYP
jgi:hypothetical protein